ncbi:hypothetical protein [Marinicella meishanensis]|uniref:hypothetical protein n=1 Tax=Marinicella meishanensis TaxID=2873263 RepID=UPI001CBCF0C1|nr:hypothetical protein [Marinicella sp. NBU2979]
MSATREYSHWPWFGLVAATLTLVAVRFGLPSPDTAYLNGNESPIHTLLTTHLSHHSWQHLSSNVVAMGLLLYLFPVRISHWLLGFWLTVVATAAVVKWHGIEAYLGFSAMLYVIPGCYVLNLMLRQQWWVCGVMLLILLTHLQVSSPLRATAPEVWMPMGIAHWIGFMAGLMSSLICVQIKTMRNQKQSPKPCHENSS